MRAAEKTDICKGAGFPVLLTSLGMSSNQINDSALIASTVDVIQKFALQNAGTADPTTLMASLVDDAQRQREQEKLELQSYFAGAGTTR